MTGASINMERRTACRRSYILVVVLGFTAVVTSLGLAFLNAHSTVMPEAINRYGGVRAQYLAESGVSLGSHFLMYPPTTVGGCDYWHGATGIAVDTTNDYTDVTVAQDATYTDTFTITAVGVAKNPDGSIRGKHTVAAKVVRPTQNKVKIPYALIGDAAYMSGVFEIPSTAHITGDVHANNGQLWGHGWCNGRVTATDWLCWMSCSGSGPPASVTGWVSVYSLPPFSAGVYSSYTVNGSTYTAYAYTDNNIDKTKAIALNAALDATMATNPGRIVVATKTTLQLNDNTVLNATLVTSGSCQLNGSIVQVTAVQDYPALLVFGNLLAQKDTTTTTLIGSLYVSGQIQDNNKNSTIINVTGAVILKKGFNLLKGNGTYNLTWDCARATFWDFANDSTTQYPITYLSWQEN